MPDIFAPVLLLVIAALTAFGRVMRGWELFLMSGLAVFSVISHPSHLAIGGLMLPLVFLAAIGVKTQARWRAAILLLVVLSIAVAERKAFQIAVETKTKKEVVYTPHITARLIVDGPGMDYLNDVCPDANIPTCALHEALYWSDDPYRMTVSHIIFERSPELGSFRLMSTEDQKSVARSQREFAKAVFLSRPIATSLALAKNGYRQIQRDGIWMTIPTEQALDNARHLARLDDSQLDMIQGGLLSKNRGWLAPVDAFHGFVYAISFAIIVVLLLIPAQRSAGYQAVCPIHPAWNCGQCAGLWGGITARRPIWSTRDVVASVYRNPSTYCLVARHLALCDRKGFVMSDQSLSISVVMPAYKAEHLLPRVLTPLIEMLNASLVQQVLVVDDQSPDGTAALAREMGATVLTTPVNGGPGAARNLAAQHATGDILWFVDSDVIAWPDGPDHIRRAMSEDNVAAVFGSYDDAPDGQSWFSRYKNLLHRYHHQRAQREARTFWAGCGAIRRDVFLEVGGFRRENLRGPFDRRY